MSGVRAALAGALLAAAGLTPAAAPAAEVALSFEGAPGGAEAGFRIERRAVGAAAFEPLALVGPGVVEFVDRSVEAGALLCYRVRPLASRSPGDWSTEVCAEAREPGSPGSEAGAVPGAPPAGAEPPAAAVEPAQPEPRRVRAGGGWLQVLE